MIINMPDPHPGRCRNWRDGERCLDHDGTEHVCSFRKPMPTPPEFWNQSSSQTTAKPKPWIKPKDGTP